MAELDKKLYIKKDSVEQTVTLYTTSEEAGEDYAYIKVDGTQAYIPLGEVDDSRATIGKIQKSSGSQFSILATAKISYHKDSYTNAGTYTWTCPADVTKARVTVAGGGGGGVASKWFTKYHGASGGNGANKTSTIDVIPHRTYTVVVGAGGLHVLVLITRTLLQVNTQVMVEFLLLIPLQPQGDKVDITSKTAYHLTTVPLMVQGAQVALHGIQAQMLGVQVGFM